MTSELRPKVEALRTPWSRWDYRDDRRSFARWVKAKRPCRHLDWDWDGRVLRLKIQPDMGHRRWYGLTKYELDLFRDGWRQLVALAIRNCREAIRHQREREHQERMAAFMRDRVELVETNFGKLHFLRRTV